MPWSDYIDEPSTKRQRAALYRLGLSYAYVHKHCRTKEKATKAIADMLKLNEDTREKSCDAVEVELTK